MNKDDELARRRERERGEKARLIVDSPLWDEAWKAIDSRLTQAWKNSTTETGQAERRELIYHQIRATAEVRGYIEDLLVTGAMAEMQIDEHERERHRSAD